MLNRKECEKIRNAKASLKQAREYYGLQGPIK